MTVDAALVFYYARYGRYHGATPACVVIWRAKLLVLDREAHMQI
jgi:hypothetical protein